VLLCALRRISLRGSELGNLRHHPFSLLKIGALMRISVRRIKIAMASACPAAQDWLRAAIRLQLAALARASPT